MLSGSITFRSVYFWLPLRGSLTFICPVYCVPYVPLRGSAVLIIVVPPNVYLLYSDLPLRGSLTFIYPVYCVPYVVRFSAPSWWFPNVYLSCVLCTLLSGSLQCLLIMDNPIEPLFTNVYLSCVLCTLWCQVLRSVNFLLPLRGSLTFISQLCTLFIWLPLRPVYCVPYVAVLIFYCSWFQRINCPQCLSYVVRFIRQRKTNIVYFWFAPSWFPNVYLSCVLCTLCCQVLRSVYFFILLLPLRGSLPLFPNVYLSCVLCTLCCQVLRSVNFLLPLQWISN